MSFYVHVMKTMSDPIYAGFSKPEANFFRLPNEWTDITARITSLAELKLVEYVLKHTWGYSEFDMVKKITTDEFMSGRKKKNGERIDTGTGLSKPSVIEGLHSAVKHGLLEVEIDDSDKARIKKYYKLKMRAPIEADEPEKEETHADVKNLYICMSFIFFWLMFLNGSSHFEFIILLNPCLIAVVCFHF